MEEQKQFEIKTASLSDLVAVMQWAKWEMKVWRKIVKDSNDPNDDEELARTERLHEAIDDEISKRMKGLLKSFAT